MAHANQTAAVWLDRAESELSQIVSKFVPYVPKYSEKLFIRAKDGRRIFEIVMQFLRLAQEDRTGFACTVADRDDVVEWPIGKFVNVL